MEDRSPSKRPVSELVSLSFGLIMVVLYIVLGTTIIFNGAEIPSIRPTYAKIFGVLLIIYGIFRGYKIYSRYIHRDRTPDQPL